MMFDPVVHGFKFENRSHFGLDDYGVCGGMAWAALDFFYRPELVMPGYRSSSFPQNSLVQGWKSAPDDPTLYDYIWSRQADSRNANWDRFVSGSLSAPNSADAYRLVTRIIGNGQPAPVGLCPTSIWPWEGHHVVAFGYQQPNELLIYDPNFLDQVMLLRIEKDNRILEFFCLHQGSKWVPDGDAAAEWGGIFAAVGYAPKAPPAGVQDLQITGAISAPASVESGDTCKVTFTVANLGEFDTALSKLDLNIDGQLFRSVDVPNGVLPLQQTFTAEFDLSLTTAGWTTLEARFRRDRNDPNRPFQPREVCKLLITQSYPKSSYLQMGGDFERPILGKKVSGPIIVNSPVPTGEPTIWEVKAWQVDVRATVRDLGGGGTFVGPITKAEWSIDGGTLQGATQALKERDAELIATYLPIKGHTSTWLNVSVTDSAGTQFDSRHPVHCTETYATYQKVHIPQHEFPRLPPIGNLINPGGRVPFSRVGTEPVPGRIVPLSPSTPRRRAR